MEIEKKLQEHDLIVSSTDAKGIINYVNSTFCEISEYTQDELYGQPHNMIRHPDMPKAIFKFVWEQLLSKKPLVAYVKNYTKDKDQYYWVKAVMYPKVENNNIAKITSYRTRATDFEIEQIKEIYSVLINYEKNHTVDESYNYFLSILKEKNLSYNKFINRLNDNQQILNTTLLNLDVQKYKIDHMIYRSRLESLIEKGYKDIDVVSSSCCDFGKKLETLENENFAHNSKFTEIKNLHNTIHQELQQFVENKNEIQRDSSMSSIYKNIDTLFNTMEDFKNKHSSTTEIK
jgi:PAS domain S-box-containing protein